MTIKHKHEYTHVRKHVYTYMCMYQNIGFEILSQIFNAIFLSEKDITMVFMV